MPITMIQRRGLATVAAVAVIAFASGAAFAEQAEQAGRSKTVLVETDYPGHGYKTQIVRVLTPANSKAPLHRHPGIESGYIIRGGGTLYIDGRPPIELKPGMTALVPPHTSHWFQNGSADTEIITTYVVEADKPITVNVEK